MAEQAPTHAQLVVLGGGPGGYPAAFEAADHGMDVVLVDQDPQPGGVCLNRGCIPSKALLHVAKLINEAHESAAWGITFSANRRSTSTSCESSRTASSAQLTGGIRQLCKARGVKLIQARGEFESSDSLKLTYPDGSTSKLSFDHAIVAVGSRPAVPRFLDIDDGRVMDSTGALNLPDIPGRLLVIGGGYIGLEMGCVYAALGSQGHRRRDAAAHPCRSRPRSRQSAEEAARRAVRGDPHEHESARASRRPTRGSSRQLEGEGVESPQTFDRVLISVGRIPNGHGIGLENTKAKVTERGFIEVDRTMRTADPKLLAIGDVAGEPMLAHKATREAKVAVEVLLGEPAAFDNVAIPAVVFTDPEVAWCGLTETQAKEQGIEVKVVRFPWAASGRAQTIARTEGLTKLIFEPKTDRVLGVGIVGAGAGEMIAEGVVAVETAAVARDLAESIHAHPTLSETIMEAAEAAYGQPTHMYRPKKK